MLCPLRLLCPLRPSSSLEAVGLRSLPPVRAPWRASLRVQTQAKLLACSAPSKKPHRGEAFIGGGWTRTNGDRSRGIYSPLQLPLCDTPRMLYEKIADSRN